LLPRESGTARYNPHFVSTCARLNLAGKSGSNWGSSRVTKRVLPPFLGPSHSAVARGLKPKVFTFRSGLYTPTSYHTGDIRDT